MIRSILLTPSKLLRSSYSTKWNNRYITTALLEQNEKFRSKKKDVSYGKNHRLNKDSILSNYCLFQHRVFSSNEEKSNLIEVLNQEITEEEENLQTTNMPDELETLLNEDIEPYWRLVDNPDSCNIRLFRKQNVGGESDYNGKIIISFHCQDTIPQETSMLDGILPQQDYNGTTEGDEEEDSEEDSDPLRFTVTVARAGKSLVFSCLSDQAMVTIESIMMVNGEDQFDVNDASSASKYQNNYQGPEFAELVQELQDELNSFLKVDCGVDENMAAFISMYADYKEQNMYVNWLKGVLSVVK